MKKIMITLVVLLLAATPAFAAVDGTYALAEDGVAIGATATGVTVSTSKGVYIAYKVSATPFDGYIVASYHNKGNRTFASSSHDTKIFRADATAQAISGMTVPTGTDGSVTWATTWNAM